MTQPHAHCPSCGAERPANLDRCWLCHLDYEQPVIPDLVAAEVPSYAGEHGSLKVNVIVGMILLSIVTVAVFGLAPGTGILLGLLVVIALLSVFGYDTGPPRESASSTANLPFVVLSFLGGILVAGGILALLALAALAALAVYCAQLMPGAPP